METKMKRAASMCQGVLEDTSLGKQQILERINRQFDLNLAL